MQAEVPRLAQSVQGLSEKRFNPAELLGSQRFKNFAALLLQHFDWVLLDTPPVMAVTDASITANMAHGVLFVVGSEMTSRRIAQRAMEQLGLGQAKFLGAVLNRVNIERDSYYYSRYYRPDYGGYYGPAAGSSGLQLQPSSGLVLSGAGSAGANTTPVAVARDALVAAVRAAAPANADAVRWTSTRAARRTGRESERGTLPARDSREA